MNLRVYAKKNIKIFVYILLNLKPNTLHTRNLLIYVIKLKNNHIKKQIIKYLLTNFRK